MVQGLFIPAMELLPVAIDGFDGLDSFQTAVDGFIEPITVRKPPLTIYVNEEGKVRHLPVNRRATYMWWLFEPASRGVDVIVGDAVVAASERSPVAVGLLRTLHGAAAGSFRVEAKSARPPFGWIPHSEPLFTDWFEAAKYAIWLEHKAVDIRDVRVVIL